MTKETRARSSKQNETGPRLTGRLLIAVWLLIALAAALLLADGRHVRFYMAGPQELSLEYGERYEDPGCRAVSMGRLFGPGSRPLAVEVQNHVDSSALGDYSVDYRARYFFFTYETSRTVHVVDTTPPVLELESREGYEPDWMLGYEEEGFRAYDLHDGDLSARVRREETPERILYTVCDASGNVAQAERRPHYSRGWPQIFIEGGEAETVPASFRYKAPSVRAADAQGLDMSGCLRQEGAVIPWQVGEYELCYFIENALGQRVEARRRVTVEPLRNPDTVEPDRPTIYLSFDDGPGPWTGRLLDLLGRYNVKATFFVTCLDPDYEDMVGRAFREGHRIGVHSASHDYDRIYASEEAYLEDFEQVEEMIFRQTGTYTDIFRFPGGSSNTVSRFNPGIVTRLAGTLRNMGYQYFDWNVDSDDAGATHETEQVFRNIVDGVEGRKTALVLQHDVKDYSVAAVERVLIWGLENGYVFAPLDADSPSAHHPIAN